MNMKATGIVRRFDDLGRIVIPREIRKHYGFNEGVPVDIYTIEDGVVLKLYAPSTVDAAKTAKDFLNQYHANIVKNQAKFSVEYNQTKCEAIVNGQRRIGIAKWNPNDKYDMNIGMVVSFCRAAGWTIPDGIL